MSDAELAALLGASPNDGRRTAAQPSGETGSRSDATSKRTWEGPVTLALLLALSWVASPRTGLPNAVPANAPDTAFSSGRAMSTLVEIAQRARPVGSPEHTRVRELLVDRLRSLGVEPEIQTTTSSIQPQENPRITRAATIRNIVARIPGTASTGAVLITAHYDSRGIAVGAADNGFGIVSIIEAVRALEAGEPLRNDLIVLLTDGEELDLLGARAFVAEHPWMDDVSLVISLEMRGGGGASLLFETNQENGWVIEAVRAFDSHPLTNSLFAEVYERLPNDTDFSPFKEAGVQGLNFAAIGDAHLYHQVYDRPENLSESTLQHHGTHALGALKHFGSVDLASVNQPDLVYFSIPWLGLVAYGQGWILPISGLLVVLLCVGGLLARRAGARLGGAVAGLGVSVSGAALSFAAASVLLAWLPHLHEESGSLLGSTYHSEGWYMLALVFSTLFIVLAVTTIGRRWLSLTELTLGAATLPVAAAVTLSVLAPLAAMNLQLPVMAGLVSVTILILLGSRAEGRVGWILALVFTVPVFLLLAPIIELSWLAMGFQIAGGLVVLQVVALFLCLPALAALSKPNRWWGPLTCLVFGGVTLGIGVLNSHPSADRPAPSTLVYAYEHETGAAVWATRPAEDGDSEARAWAIEQASGLFTETQDLSRFAYRSGTVPTASAPVVTAAPPSVVIVSNTILADVRSVALRVHSRIGAETLWFGYDPERSTRIVSVNGVDVSHPANLLWVEYWGEPEGDVILELTMPPDEPIGLHVVEHLLRPEELLGDAPFVRPDHLAPDVTRMSDRVMLRYSVAAFVDPRHAIVLPEHDAPDPQ